MSERTPAGGALEQGPDQRSVALRRRDEATAAYEAAKTLFARRWAFPSQPPRHGGWSRMRRVHRGGSGLLRCFGGRAADRGAGRETFSRARRENEMEPPLDARSVEGRGGDATRRSLFLRWVHWDLSWESFSR